MYTYMHNLQGDIVGILDSAGTLVVEYKYDAWGKPLGTTGSMADTLGVRNPFRYRRYVYDGESGLYCLQSRFYLPTIGRFINSDSYLMPELMASNTYVYCKNNPISRADIAGCTDYYNVYLNVYDQSLVKTTGHYDLTITAISGNCITFDENDRLFSTSENENKRLFRE